MSLIRKHKEFCYKGFKGTVNEYEHEDFRFSGEVVGLRKFSQYEADCLNELYEQFKVRVERFIQECDELGVEAKPTNITDFFSKLLLALVFVLAVVSGGIIYSIYPEIELASDSIPKAAEVKRLWMNDLASFFNGFSGPLFSFLSLSAILYTLYRQTETHRLQLIQLETTKEDLKLTRDELTETTEANKRQAEALVEQSRLQGVNDELNRFDKHFDELKSSLEALLSSEHDWHSTEFESKERAAKKFGKQSVYDLECGHLAIKLNASRDVEVYFQCLDLLYVIDEFFGRKLADADSKYSKVLTEQRDRYVSVLRLAISKGFRIGMAIYFSQHWAKKSRFHDKYSLLVKYSFLQGVSISIVPHYVMAKERYDSYFLHYETQLLALYPAKIWGNQLDVLFTTSDVKKYFSRLEGGNLLPKIGDTILWYIPSSTIETWQDRVMLSEFDACE